MYSHVSLLKKDFQLQRNWLIGWIIGISIFNLMIFSIYPGEEGVQSLLGLLDNEAYQAFLGQLDSDAAPQVIWLMFALPSMALIGYIGAVLYGVRGILVDVDLGTNEFFFTLPIRRTTNLLIEMVNGQLITLFLNLSIILPWFFPLDGKTIETDILVKMTISLQLFLTVGYIFGMLLGTLTSNQGRGQQLGLLASISFFVLQAVARISEPLETIADFIPINWFDPAHVAFKNEYDVDGIRSMVLFILACGAAVIYLYQRKEMVADAGWTLTKPQSTQSEEKTVAIPKPEKSNTSGWLVFWARAIKNRLPFTADFLFSEARVMTIMFWVIVMIYPLQLMLYPGDEETLLLMQGFDFGGIGALILMGQTVTDPYLWFQITQAFGAHWMFMLPATIFWSKKIVSFDRDKETGEIIGSYPLDTKQFLRQRLLALLIELTILVGFMIAFTLVADLTYNQLNEQTVWKAIAILGIIPMYTFLITLAAIPILLDHNRGILINRMLLLGLFLWFAVPLISQPSVQWYEMGIFGLYNPIQIILDQQWFPAANGLLILSALATISSFAMIRLAHKIPFINVD